MKSLIISVLFAFVPASAMATEMAFQHVDVNFQLRQPKRLLRVLNHVHTQNDNSDFVRHPDEEPLENSYSSKGLRYLKNLAVQNKIDVMMISEHNTLAHCYDSEFKSSPNVLFICGEEWTSKVGPHLGMFWLDPDLRPNRALLPPDASRAASEEEVQDAIVEGNRLGAFVSLNHPGYSWYQVSGPNGADMIEAMVPFYSMPKLTEIFWSEQLRRGFRVPGIAGSDLHPQSGFRGLFSDPLNILLWNDEPVTAANVMKAMTSGRLVMVDSRDQAAMIFAQVTTDLGTGSYGDIIPAGTKGHLDVEVQNAQNLELVVQDEVGQILSEPIYQNGHVQFSLALRNPHGRGFVRLSLRSRLSDNPVVMTNPIYFQ